MSKQLDLFGNEVCTHKDLDFCPCMALGCKYRICKKCGKVLSEEEVLIIDRRRWFYLKYV